MSARCHFPDHTGDPAVFGVCRECNPEPQNAPASRLVDLPPLVPSWVFVVPPEQPWETALADDVEPGDLG